MRDENGNEPVMPEIPPGAEIVVADAKGYTDKEMRGPAYLWTWVGAARWFYVSQCPVPTR